MVFWSDLFSRKVARAASVAAVACALVTGAVSTPALAQGKHKNKNKVVFVDQSGAPSGIVVTRPEGKKYRQAQAYGNTVVVAPQHSTTDPRATWGNSSSARVRQQQQYRRYNNGRVYDYRNTPVDPYANYPQYRRNPYTTNNGYYNYPSTGTYNYPSNTYGYGYPSNTYGYPNSGSYGAPYGYSSYPNDSRYYSDRRGDLDRNEVARRGAQIGYQDGYQRGQYDRAQGVRRPNPQGHGAYQNAFNGFNPEWGYALTFQQTYRQYFLQGYNSGYGRGSYDRRYNNRWW